MAEAFFSLNIITLKFLDVLSLYLELVMSWIPLYHVSICVVSRFRVIYH